MRRRSIAALRTSLLLLAALAAAGPGHATTIDLSWDRCAPIVADTAIHPNIEQYRLWVSAVGQSEPHRGYEFWIAIHDADGGVPDAWRFDEGGCQPAGSVVIDYLNPVETTKACPTFQGALPSVPIRAYVPAPAHLGLSGSPMVALVADAYPDGVHHPDPTTRYFLGSFRFDHTQSVPGVAPDTEHCGGVDRPLCFTLIGARTSWYDLDLAEHRFVIGNGVVTVNGGGCAPVPAASATWGGIKGQYRR